MTRPPMVRVGAYDQIMNFVALNEQLAKAKAKKGLSPRR